MKLHQLTSADQTWQLTAERSFVLPRNGSACIESTDVDTNQQDSFDSRPEVGVGCPSIGYRTAVTNR